MGYVLVRVVSKKAQQPSEDSGRSNRQLFLKIILPVFGKSFDLKSNLGKCTVPNMIYTSRWIIIVCNTFNNRTSFLNAKKAVLVFGRAKNLSFFTFADFISTQNIVKGFHAMSS